MELKYNTGIIGKEGQVEVVNKWDDLEKDISKEINTKFGLLRRVIGRAKWRGYFSSSHNKNVTFGRWYKR